LYSFVPLPDDDAPPKSFLKDLGAEETGRGRALDEDCATTMFRQCGRAAFATVFADEAHAMRRLAIHWSTSRL
jgi:hypothetical protein